MRVRSGNLSGMCVQARKVTRARGEEDLTMQNEDFKKSEFKTIWLRIETTVHQVQITQK